MEVFVENYWKCSYARAQRARIILSQTFYAQPIENGLCVK